MTESNNNGKTKIRLILFDFDGTLVNTTPLILRSFHATWLRVFGFTLTDEDYVRTFGMMILNAFKDLMVQSMGMGLLEKPENLDDYLERKSVAMLPVYREFNLGWHDEMIEPFPEIDLMLKELKAREYRLGVVSSKMRSGVERGMNIFAMNEMFDIIIGAEDVANHKPHPEPLIKAMEMLDGAPCETIYIGDSTHDITAGRAAGMLVAAVTWGPFPRKDLEVLRPDYLLDAPLQLLEIINN